MASSSSAVGDIVPEPQSPQQLTSLQPDSITTPLLENLDEETTPLLLENLDEETTPLLEFIRLVKRVNCVQNYEEKQVLNLLEFCEQLESKGTVENSEINVSDLAFHSSKRSYPLNLNICNFEFIIDLRLIEEQQIFLKNLTFIQHEVGNQERNCILVQIRSNQHLVVSNCSFNAIGFKVRGSFIRKNNSVSLSDINVSNTEWNGLFFGSIHSVSLNRIEIINCKWHGFYSVDVENVRVENAKISQCDHFGMSIHNTKNFYGKNFYGQFIEVERCQRGFSFLNCEGELKNIKIRDCKDDIGTIHSEIKQTDVRKIGPSLCSIL